MKTSNTPILKKTIAALLLTAIAIGTNAQKLPGVQLAGVRAPADIKVDGKTTEWHDQFQAYNRATDVYYTLSNDDDHLYLTLQAAIPDIINKIIGGGITLTIQKSGKKNDKDGMSITYPIFTKDNRPSLGINRRISVENGVTKTETSQDALTDSIIAVRNKQLADKAKYIGISGIPGLDSLISVYNENGIKTGQAISTKGAYTYELSIELKTLGITANDASKFAYHIMINGLGKPVMTIKVQNADGTTATNSAAAQNPEVSEMIAKMTNAMNAGGLFAPTDFWGEYTLVKK